MFIATMKVINETGIQARPAVMLVQSASQYMSEINIEYKGRKVNLKSIMGVMSLGIKHGAEVQITTQGYDEHEAITAIKKIMETEKLAR